jgi:hypothetical protein
MNGQQFHFVDHQYYPFSRFYTRLFFYTAIALYTVAGIFVGRGNDAAAKQNGQ